MTGRTILAVVLGSFLVLAGQEDMIMAAPGTHMTNASKNRVASTLLTSGDGVPGTLGLTYQQRTKRVNSDIHPRVGLLEITVSDETVRNLPAGHEIQVRVADEAGHFEELEGYFGEDDKWHFESKPLYPGIPHIYDVKFEELKIETKRERKYDKIVESEVQKKVRDLGVRRVRLIPGRTVFLNYQ